MVSLMAGEISGEKLVRSYTCEAERHFLFACDAPYSRCSLSVVVSIFFERLTSSSLTTNIEP